jgi:hypothetical protein
MDPRWIIRLVYLESFQIRYRYLKPIQTSFRVLPSRRARRSAPGTVPATPART